MPRWLKGLCSGSALLDGGDKPIKACFGPLLEAQQGAVRQGCKGWWATHKDSTLEHDDAGNKLPRQSFGALANFEPNEP
jgi:hypothetical protein